MIAGVCELLDQGRSAEKVYQVDDHVICAVAGMTADANILINKLRLTAQRYMYRYLATLGQGFKIILSQKKCFFETDI